MHRRLILPCAVLAAALAGCGSSSGDGGAGGAGRGASGNRTLGVQTDSGPVEGFEDDGVYSYRGIPYAAPPVGELRWQPPTAPESWTDTLVTTDRPNGCIQAAFNGLAIPGFVASEDCLYLKPVLSSSA